MDEPGVGKRDSKINPAGDTLRDLTRQRPRSVLQYHWVHTTARAPAHDEPLLMTWVAILRELCCITMNARQ